jgi:hypothetical protein
MRGGLMTATIAGELAEHPAVLPEYAHLYEGRPDANCWVYEVWDTRGRLAYVGIADSFERRWQQHISSSWWLGEIDVWYISVYGYRTRWEARRVEACTINQQCPVYNTRLETSAYEAYLTTCEDEWDCIPMKKRLFAPLGSTVF